VQTERAKKVELRKCGIKQWKQPLCLRTISEGESAPSSHNAISSISILQRLGFRARLYCGDLDESPGDLLRGWLGRFGDARKEEVEQELDCHTYTFERIKS
jgi:hypothetical protein